MCVSGDVFRVVFQSIVSPGGFESFFFSITSKLGRYCFQLVDGVSPSRTAVSDGELDAQFCVSRNDVTVHV